MKTKQLKKYWAVFATSWQNGLAYRASFLLWRGRQMLSTIMAITIWSVIFSQGQTAFGYTDREMLSYVLLVSMLQSLILASSQHGLAGEIYNGNMSQSFIRPIKMFRMLASVEAADKLRNLIMSIVEGAVLIAIFHPPIVIPSLPVFALFVVWSLLGTLIHFYITILFGTLGFWSPDTWAPKFLFFMILDFTAGRLYPLDVLPSLMQKILFLTPFPYFSYAQIQLFLGRLSPELVLQFSVGLVVWTVGLWWLASKIWNKGVKSYEATGG